MSRYTGLRIDPTVPVHRQPTMVVHFGWEHVARDHIHAWFMYLNGVECPRCTRLLVRLDGRRRYRGRHRNPR